MKQSNYSLNLYWDSRVVDKKTKTSRIFLTVNLQRNQFRLSLKLRSTKEDFKKAQSSSRNITESIYKLKTQLNEYVLKAENILQRLPSVDKELFLRLYKSEADLFISNKTDVYYFFEYKMTEAFAENRFGTYRYYKQCKANLKKYKPELSFDVINEKWLRNYQLYLKGNGNSNTTVAMRLRCLRLVYNCAVKQGFVSELSKPFENIQTGSTIKSKSVLYPAQLKALWDYQPVGIREHRAKATFFFLYLANGMNPKDMAYLKYSNLKSDSFVFVREKTKHTKNDVSEIVVHLNDVLKAIIEVWGNKDKSGYIFPILSGCRDLAHMEETRLRHKHTCNKFLGKIGKKLGFEVHLCLNLARHSFATMHKILGTPTSFISDAMGHSNSAMTEHYMKSLPDENRREMSQKLLSFV